MYVYLFWGAVSFCLWGLYTFPLVAKAKDTRDPKIARQAQLAWASIVLLPIYPIAAVAVGIGYIFKNFVQLGRIAKEEEK